MDKLWKNVVAGIGLLLYTCDKLNRRTKKRAKAAQVGLQSPYAVYRDYTTATQCLDSF